MMRTAALKTVLVVRGSTFSPPSALKPAATFAARCINSSSSRQGGSSTRPCASPAAAAAFAVEPAPSALLANEHLPPHRYMFGTHNEDSSVELLAVQLVRNNRNGKKLRVLSIAACGTHALSLCSSLHVASVDAVDISHSQIAVASLTAAGASTLTTPEELAVLLGTGGEPASRLSLYRTVRAALSPAAAEWWDTNLDTLAAGVMRCGGAERLYAECRARLPLHGRDVAAMRQEWGATRAALRAVYGDPDMWRTYMVGMPDGAVARLTERLPLTLEARLAPQLEQWTPSSATPPVLHALSHGTYCMGDDRDRPVFLRRGNYASMRRLGCGPERLRFHEGPLQEVGVRLTASHGAFNLVDMSNILDMLDTPELAHPMVAAAASCLTPGGALLCRFSTATTRDFLSSVFRDCGLGVDKGVNDALLAAETSPFMADVCLGVAPALQEQ